MHNSAVKRAFDVVEDGPSFSAPVLVWAPSEMCCHLEFSSSVGPFCRTIQFGWDCSQFHRLSTHHAQVLNCSGQFCVAFSSAGFFFAPYCDSYLWPKEPRNSVSHGSFEHSRSSAACGARACRTRASWTWNAATFRRSTWWGVAQCWLPLGILHSFLSQDAHWISRYHRTVDVGGFGGNRFSWTEMISHEAPGSPRLNLLKRGCSKATQTQVSGSACNWWMPPG